MHFFAGDIEVARRVVELGGTMSFTGVITFAAQYDEVVREVPLDRIMSETDAPYVTPKPHRGTRNEPVYVEHVIARIAELKGLPLEVVSAALRANARRVFGV
jgi:TatD DNase family protein